MLSAVPTQTGCVFIMPLLSGHVALMHSSCSPSISSNGNRILSIDLCPIWPSERGRPQPPGPCPASSPALKRGCSRCVGSFALLPVLHRSHLRQYQPGIEKERGRTVIPVHDAAAARRHRPGSRALFRVRRLGYINRQRAACRARAGPFGRADEYNNELNQETATTIQGNANRSFVSILIGNCVIEPAP